MLKIQFPSGDGLDAPTRLELISKKLFLHPLINYLVPAGLLRAVVRTSPLGAQAMARPGGWRALEICYSDGSPKNIVDWIVSKRAFFPRAARNRRILVVTEVTRLIGLCEKGVLILSLGSGPGRCEMEAMKEAGVGGCRLLCFDIDAEAFEYGRELSRRLGMEEDVSFLQGDVEALAGVGDVSVDIVTMLGFLGYFDDGSLQQVLREVFRVVKPGGRIVTNSISASHGVDRFMERVFKWSHHYRSPSVVASFLKRAGFEQLEEIPEPLGVYSIMIGRRP